MIMYGTTLFLIEVVSDLTISDGVWATAGVRPNTWNTAATLPTSGAITTWLSKLTATDFETLIAEAASSPPGANGLLLLPHFEGERTPRFDADMRGALVGLSLAHTRGDIYRAALEGTGFGAREILAAMTAGTDRMSPARIVAVGGGTTGSLWPQIISDVTGLAQELPTETVGACLGDAMLAALGSGVTDDVAAWNLPMARVVPSSAARARYDEMYCDYLALTARTRDVAHRLAAHRREVT
jgi:xylulokinase